MVLWRFQQSFFFSVTVAISSSSTTWLPVFWTVIIHDMDYKHTSSYFLITLQQTFYFHPSEITIGFEQGTYTVQEDLQPTVEVCAEILQRSVDRSTAVIFMFEDQNGLAGSAKNLQTSTIDSTMEHISLCAILNLYMYSSCYH